MTDPEYLDVQSRLMALARLSLDLDLDGLLQRIALAETVGPALDSELYRAAAPSLAAIRDLARAAQALRRAAAAALPRGAA